MEAGHLREWTFGELAQSIGLLVLPYNIAKIYAAMGDAEKAFVWLETSYKEGNPDLIELNSEPVFDAIRAAPRFGELMQRVGWEV
jgi:hypothetical protein